VLGPVSEDLTPCSPSTTDVWEFYVTVGSAIDIAADTGDATTAADLCFNGTCLGQGTFGGDDEMSCTFPPPSYACPASSFVALDSGLCTLGMTLCSASCTDLATANYVLSVTGDGFPLALTLVGDDM
jgi:hypothetical protein